MVRAVRFSSSNSGFEADWAEDCGELDAVVETLHGLFSARAAAFPKNTAVESEGVKITYEDLDKKSNQFARLLQEQFGIKPEREDVVAILLPRCPELYLTMLSVMKAGGVYVCIDPQHQKSRLEFVLQDTKAVALVTTKHTQSELCLGDVATTTILDIKSSSLNTQIASQANSAVEACVPGSNLCYIIYTSGSTGKPKGVEIEHKTVVNFIRGELEIFPVSSDETERVLQGFSPSFDASVEEIWLAFSTASTLVVATPEVMQSGPDLPVHLNKLNITVFSTVPTLLRTITASSTSLPNLKLLILGGEACGEDLVAWSDGRMLVNSYGPTEATVVATTCNIQPNKKITIGRPLRNYYAYVLSKGSLEEVEHGTEGELCIGGKCLARGYRNLPEKTSLQFVEHPVHGRIYRTGDLVRLTPEGEIDYLGRIDDQVKIRGFRVEIGSIEIHLQKQENVKMAAVVILSPAPGQQLVVAHITLTDSNTGFHAQRAASNMKEALPEYMVPNGYIIHHELPTLASGKVDKKKLKGLDTKPQSFNASEKYTAPRDDIEKTICEVWESKLCNPRISIDDNFFNLGGQSVVAALVISELRKKNLELSVRDLYLNPTVAALADHYKTESVASDKDHVTVHMPDTPTQGKPRYYLCALLQALWILGWSFALGVWVLFVILTFIDLYIALYELAGYQGIAWLMVGFLLLGIPLYVVSMMLWAYLMKKILLGTDKPGAYALWSMYYLRWWMVNNAKSLVPTRLMSGTPLMNVYARLMGAKIGHGVYYGSHIPCDYGLIELQSGVCIEPDVSLSTHRVDRGTLFLGRITIEEHCSIGARSTIAIGSLVKKHSRIEPLTLVPDNSVVEEGSHMRGSPAKPSSGRKPAEVCDWKWAWWVPCLQMAVLCLFSVFYIVPYIALIIVILTVTDLKNELVNKNWTLVAIVIPPTAIFSQALGLVLTAVVKWCIVGRLKEGNFSINSLVFVKFWTMERIINFTLWSSRELFATLYTNIWLKTLGMKVGKLAEISTAFNFVPDLVHLDDRTFIADHVSLGGATFGNGCFTLHQTSVGRRTFLGNNCVFMPNSTVGSDVLVGVMSTTPDAAIKKSSWLGSPSFLLPTRAISKKSHSSARTFSPPLYLYVSRLIWEGFKIILPSMTKLYSLYLFWVLVDELSYTYFEEGSALFWFSAVLWQILIVLCNLLFVLLAKWILIGRFRPSEHPLWSSFVWRSELVASLEENVAMPMGLGGTLGTPFICWWYRALGAKIGSRVYLASIYLTEADLIEIGDEACIGGGTTIQSHLFEDRIMKMDKLYIGDECTVSSDSVVLYGARMENRCTLMPLSLCMKSETLESDAVYCGIPAQKVIAELHHGYHIDWQLTRVVRESHVYTACSRSVKLTGYRKLIDV